jgi:hypothetical protein
LELTCHCSAATAPVAAAEAKKAEEHHHSGSVFGLIVGSLGIYVCYAAYGLAQERMCDRTLGCCRQLTSFPFCAV